MGSNRTRCIGYCRVSTDHQAERGISLEAQRAKLAAYAVAIDLDLVTIVEDAGVSAKSLERPGLSEALKMLEAGQASGLLVVKLDRLTRSVRDLGDLVELYFAARFSLLSVNDSVDTRTASGRMVLNIMTTIAQWEREAGSERTRDALAALKSKGVKLGREPLGLTRTARRDAEGRCHVAPVAEEAATVRWIFELRCQGCSLAKIVSMLTERGSPTKRNGKWAPETVRKILARGSAAA